MRIQYGHRFARHISNAFYCIKIVVFVTQISPKCVPESPIDNMLGLDNSLVPDWRQTIIWTNDGLDEIRTHRLWKANIDNNEGHFL